MKRSNPNLVFVIIVPLVLLALAAVMFALWLVDHRSALPNSGVILAVSMGIFFVVFLTAFLLLLRFKQRHFLPYYGGHTSVFEERALYLQEDQNRDILENFSDYIVQIGQG